MLRTCATFSFLVLMSLGLLCASPAQAQDVSLLPTSLTFSNQAVGTTSAAQVITLTNTDGVHSLTVSSVVPSGDFIESDNCVPSVAAGKTCTISVQFKPGSTGAIDGSISVFDNAPASPQVLGLTGTGIAQETVSPATLNLGTMSIGKTSAIKTVKLTNNTASSIAITSISASGDFTATPAASNGCTTSLAANASCTEDVFFTPTELGTVVGSVVFSDAGTQQYVTLTAKGSGTADSPLTITPASLAFGNQTLGSSALASATIENTTGSTIALTFTPSASYSKSGTCTGNLGGGSICTVDVEFSPTVLGAIDGGLSISYTGANSPQVISLTGAGIGQVTLSPASIIFAAQQAGTTSGVHKITVTNNSSSAVSVSSVVYSGDFKETDNCTPSIMVGSTCTISASFAPTRGGSVSGSIILTDSATNSPQIVDLSGTGYLVPRFAYVANSGDGTVSIYTVNSKTGQLRSSGYVLEAAGASLVAVDPSGRFAYVVNSTADNITAYTINASTGQLTEVSGGPISTGTFPQSITIDPSGKFVYVANNGSGNVSAYTINGDTGALSAVTGSPFAAETEANSVVVLPSGRFAYVANQGTTADAISGYSIDPITGALTQVSGSPFAYPSTDGGRATSVAADPVGNFLYVTSNNDSNAAAYTINATTGKLTLASSSPYPVPGDAASIVVAPSGKFVYIAGGGGSETLSVFKINATTGALTAGLPVTVGEDPLSLTLDPEGNVLYVTNSNEVWTYTLNAGSGVPTLLTKNRTRQSPTAVALGGGTAAVAYTPKFAYAANSGSNNVSAYTINSSNGKITALSGSPFGAGTTPNSVTVDPFGKFAYVANTGSTNISEYTINSNGTLSAVSGSPLSTVAAPLLVAVDPSGRFAFVGEDNATISAYAIDASTGALSLVTGSALTTTQLPTGAAVDPTGQFLYVTSASFDGNSGYVCVYTIDLSTGVLTQITGSPFTNGINAPSSVAMDASGLYAYVANLNVIDDIWSMSSFTINSTTGAPTLLDLSPNLGASSASVATDPLGQFLYATQPAATNDLVALSVSPTTFRFTILNTDVCIPQEDPVSLAVDPSGKFAYVANETAGTITACAIDTTTGDLSNISGQAGVAAGTGPASVTTTGTIH